MTCILVSAILLWTFAHRAFCCSGVPDIKSQFVIVCSVHYWIVYFFYKDDWEFGQCYLVSDSSTSCHILVSKYSRVLPISPVALLGLSRKRSEVSSLVFIAWLKFTRSIRWQCVAKGGKWPLSAAYLFWVGACGCTTPGPSPSPAWSVVCAQTRLKLSGFAHA